MTDSPTKPATGRREEIEITDAMIEAGAIAVSLYDITNETADERAVVVYLAMEEVSRRQK